MPEAVIVDAVRTPIGALGGSLAAVRPDDLAAHILKTLVKRTGIDPALIEEVYLAARMAPARITATWHAWLPCSRVFRSRCRL